MNMKIVLPASWNGGFYIYSGSKLNDFGYADDFLLLINEAHTL